MKNKSDCFYIISGVFFGFLYSLLPMYINVVFVQKIVEYVIEMEFTELAFLCMLSVIVIMIAELLNSIYENMIKPELKIKIHDEVMTYYFESFKGVDLKTINEDDNYNNIKLIENQLLEQKIDFFDNIIATILQFSVIISLVAFLVTQNAMITIGVIVYVIIINMVGKKLNKRKLNFQSEIQSLMTKKEILTNYYLLPEYSEYIRDDEIDREAVSNFGDVCLKIMEENKKFFKRIFVTNTLCIGGSNVLIEYLSLIILGYIKIGRSLITTAQFLSYYRAIDILINGIDFLSGSINKLHFNYIFLKNSHMKIKKNLNATMKNFESLELKDVCFAVDNKDILVDVSLRVKKGNKIAVIGQNASGKTTLLKIVADIIHRTSGEIKVNGICIGTEQPSACYVPAGTVFFPWEKIENDFFDAFLSNAGYRDGELIVRGIQEFLSHKMLSEGEKKILMIIRAFSTNCDLIVLDEPFANLDYEWKAVMEELIYGSMRTVVFSTHDTTSLSRCTDVLEMRRQ